MKKLNWAEIFALSRVVTFPVILIFIFLNERTISAWLFLVLFSTDVADGFFAHFFQMESARRSMLDSLGDLLFLLTGLIGFYVFEKEFFLGHWQWMALLGLLYLAQLTISLIKFRRPSSFHTYTARIAAVFYFIFLSWTFFFGVSDFLFYTAFFFGALEGLDEILVGLHLEKWDNNVKGIWFILADEQHQKNNNH